MGNIDNTDEFNVCGIYRILNKVSGKSYIGQSPHIGQRLHAHARQLVKNIHANEDLQNDFNTDGGEIFICHVIEQVPIEELNAVYLSYLRIAQRSPNLYYNTDCQ